MQKYKWQVKDTDEERRVNDEAVLRTILKNRGIKTKKDQEAFLQPDIKTLFTDIEFPEIKKAVKRIKQAVESGEKIIIFSDYDADGINAAAILWETINDMGGDVKPYMPHRLTEGYGLSVTAVEKLAGEGTGLIITVDNGITAVAPVEAANNLGVDVIITDHHQKPKEMPKPYCFVWSDQICGAAVAFVLSKHLIGDFDDRRHLELAALATITDVMPLMRFNRAIVIEGLKELNQTKRVGLQALFHEANLEPGKIDGWAIGHVIGPRLNAMGRLDNAMDSLRLLCTKNPLKAKSLCLLLAKTNTDRQKLTETMVEDAKLLYDENCIVGVISSETWHEGVVGLVAGRMAERYYRPMIAIAVGQEVSKGSARSIPGFNIIEALRSLNGTFENVGGHPMAAGFSIRTEKIKFLHEQINKIAKKQCDDTVLARKLAVEMYLPFSAITVDVYNSVHLLEPFGNANDEPIFATKQVTVEEIKKVGQKGQHAKLIVSDADGEDSSYYTHKKPFFEAVGFGMGELLTKLRPGDVLDIAYALSLNVWNGKTKLELKLKDLKRSS